MWPWEHLAVGYLLYTGLVRWRFDRPPTGRETVALAVGTQLPDLVDKPLAWSVSVLPSGQSLGHSVFTLAALSILFTPFVVRGRTPLLALLVGQASHLVGDLLYSPLTGGAIYPEIVLWPVASIPPSSSTPGLVTAFFALLEGFRAFLGTPLGRLYLLGELLLLSAALAAWLVDGRPGLPRLRPETAGSRG